MEENNIGQQPNTEQNNAQQEQEGLSQESPQEEKSMGAILGSIIVVIILLVAAFYLWGSRPEGELEIPAVESPTEILQDETETTAENILEEEDLQTEALEAQGTSDELSAIEEDLNATDLEDLTRELDNIDAELGL